MVKYALALALALLLNAAANLMIRFGMRALDLELGGADLLDGGLVGLAKLLLRHWIVLAGMACFATNLAFYAYALQKLPISVAYPIMVAGGFAIIAIVAAMRLGERLSLLQWLGVAAILVGVALVARDAGRQLGRGAGAPPAVGAAP